jgi:hypothetical protein
MVPGTKQKEPTTASSSASCPWQNLSRRWQAQDPSVKIPQGADLPRR